MLKNIGRKTMDKTSLGDRMKAYEAATGAVLVPRMPAIIRVDGKAFHSWTKKNLSRINPEYEIESECEMIGGPSPTLHRMMVRTAQGMCTGVQNAVLAYIQSDEISILLRDYDQLNTQQWFGGKVQKIVSVSASMASSYFNLYWTRYGAPFHINDVALFDARVFQIPKEDVTNYFIWRQRDATRNSVNYIARQFFSHKELIGRNVGEVHEMLWSEHGINWDKYDTWMKRGSCVIQSNDKGWMEDDDIPIFTQDREYIEKFANPGSDDEL